VLRDALVADGAEVPVLRRIEAAQQEAARAQAAADPFDELDRLRPGKIVQREAGDHHLRAGLADGERAPEIPAMKAGLRSAKLRQYDRRKRKIEGDYAMAGADEGCRVPAGAAAELEHRVPARALANERKPAVEPGIGGHGAAS